MSSGLFDEVPWWGYLALTLIVTVPSGIVASDAVFKYKAQQECTAAVAQWMRETENVALFRPSEFAYFATRYRLYRLACPQGSELVDESTIPAAVKAGYVPSKK